MPIRASVEAVTAAAAFFDGVTRKRYVSIL
jgi:hypothetical protein